MGRSKANKWFPLYARDYLADTKVSALTLTQQAILIRLWCHLWADGPLPNNLGSLTRITGGETDDIQTVIGQFFDSSDDGKTLVNPRMETEREAVERRYEAVTQTILKVNKAKKLKHMDQAGHQTGAKLDSKFGGTFTYTYTKTKRKDFRLRREHQAPMSISTTAALPDEFEEAWSVYPKRPGNSKAGALKQWNARIKEGAAPRDMLAGTEAYATYVKREGTDPRYVKMAATFFGPGRHWEADYGEVEPEVPPLYLPNGDDNPEAYLYLQRQGLVP